MSLRKMLAIGAALASVAGTASVAGAATLLEPTRSYLMGTSEVVWGVTTQANGTAFTLNYGDGSAPTATTVVDRSYIAYSHTYATSGTFTVTLKVGTEVATTTVNVYNATTLSANDLRNLNVNRTIQDGLRNLWYTQVPRTTFDTNVSTYWNGYTNPFTGLVAQAFQNQGYQVNDSTPNGIYEKYAVGPGLNYLFEHLTPLNIGLKSTGTQPCVGVPVTAGSCSVLVADTTSYDGYENGIVMLALAGSGALTKTVTDTNAPAVVQGQTYGSILQQLVDASAWGQNSSGYTGPNNTSGNTVGRGGWYYYFDSDSNDGSVEGWELQGLRDAAGAGATVPSFVATEFASYALPDAINSDGSFDYQADGLPKSGEYPELARAGVGLQGMAFAGYSAASNTPIGTAYTETQAAAIANGLNWIGQQWNYVNGSPAPTGITPVAGYASYACPNGTYNKGCAYGMYNIYKGLKLLGVQTLPGVGRAAGPGTIAANDWYADTVDWLVANQTNQTSTTGGNWGSLYFSGAYGTVGLAESNALAELILSPTALVLPDPTLFSSVGLEQGSPLSTNPETDDTSTPAAMHTVTALTLASNHAPIAGVTVNFSVISGPNAGATGSGTTGSNGQATFTYTDNGGAGTDDIVATVGTSLTSNTLVENWVKPPPPTIVCDVNGDGVVNNTDLTLIRAKNGQAASGPNDPFDANHDGVINVADVRYCQLRLTPTN